MCCQAQELYEISCFLSLSRLFILVFSHSSSNDDDDDDDIIMALHDNIGSLILALEFINMMFHYFHCRQLLKSLFQDISKQQE